MATSKITERPNGDLLIPIRDRPGGLRRSKDAYVVHPGDDDYEQHYAIYERQREKADGRWLRVFGWVGVVVFIPLAMLMGLMLLFQDKRGGGLIIGAALAWWTLLFILFTMF